MSARIRLLFCKCMLLVIFHFIQIVVTLFMFELMHTFKYTCVTLGCGKFNCRIELSETRVKVEKYNQTKMLKSTHFTCLIGRGSQLLHHALYSANCLADKVFCL